MQASTEQQRTLNSHLLKRKKNLSRKVWCVADTLHNTGNEALAESDNYFN